MEFILFFREAGSQDLDKIGAKALILSNLLKRGFKVPPGFIISSDVLDILLGTPVIKNKVKDLFTCPEQEIEERSKEVQKIIRGAQFPPELIAEIQEAYESLSISLGNTTASSLLKTAEVYVAVRTSYIKGAKTQKSILNVKGMERLLKAILECYAAHVKPEAILEMRENNINSISSGIIVQIMVESEKAGIAFSVNEGNPKEILIQACFGLGEGIASGSVYPDIYLVDKKSLKLTKVKVGEKNYAFMRDADTEQTAKFKLGDRTFQQVLYHNEVEEIARILKKIVRAFEEEVEIEWAIKDDEIYVLEAQGMDYEYKSVEMEIYGPEEEEGEIDIDEQIPPPIPVEPDHPVHTDPHVLKEEEEEGKEHIEEEYEDVEFVSFDSPSLDRPEPQTQAAEQSEIQAKDAEHEGPEDEYEGDETEGYESEEDSEEDYEDQEQVIEYFEDEPEEEQDEDEPEEDSFEGDDEDEDEPEDEDNYEGDDEEKNSYEDESEEDDDEEYEDDDEPEEDSDEEDEEIVTIVPQIEIVDIDEPDEEVLEEHVRNFGEVDEIEEEIDELQEEVEEMEKEIEETKEMAEEIEEIQQDFQDSPLEEQETEKDPSVEKEKVVLLDDLSKDSFEDDSIFSSYKGFDSFKVEPEVEKLMEVHSRIHAKLQEKLSEHTEKLPDNFIGMLNKLLDYEDVDIEHELRMLNRAVLEYETSGKVPQNILKLLDLDL